MSFSPNKTKKKCVVTQVKNWSVTQKQKRSCRDEK